VGTNLRSKTDAIFSIAFCSTREINRRNIEDNDDVRFSRETLTKTLLQFAFSTVDYDWRREFKPTYEKPVMISTASPYR
jgi:hypothetical protein